MGKVPLAAVAMEREGTSTERGDEQRAVRARNQERRELTQQLREISARIAETMRNLGDKAKGMAQGLRDRLGAAWGRQDQAADRGAAERIAEATRSEEHTSELQSLMSNSYAVFCLQKKKKQTVISSSQVD